MAFAIYDNVQETSTTTGTGDFTVSGAVAANKTLASSYSVDDTLPYSIKAVDAVGVPTGEWEVGIGTYSAANTLTRTTVLSSSNSDALVSFSAGTKRVSVVFTAAQGRWIRERLTAARTYYVRTDGSDSNNGLANTSGGAFLTIQKAIDIVAGTLDTAGYEVTIQVADGTYTTPIIAKVVVGGGAVVINGNSGTPTNVIINTTSATCFTHTSGQVSYSLRYMKLTTTTSGNCIYCGANSRVYFSGIDFGAAPGSTHIYAEQQGVVQAQATYTISGSAAYHYTAGSQAEIRVTGAAWTVTISGSPTFTAFAYCGALGFLHHNSVTFSGTVTGKRYDVVENGLVKTYGGGASYFPGTVAGTTATGGQYT